MCEENRYLPHLDIECDTSWILASFSAWRAYCFCRSVSAAIMVDSCESTSLVAKASWFCWPAIDSALCRITSCSSDTILCRAPVSSRSTISGSLGWVVDSELRMIGRKRGIRCKIRRCHERLFLGFPWDAFKFFDVHKRLISILEFLCILKIHRFFRILLNCKNISCLSFWNCKRGTLKLVDKIQLFKL